MELNFNNVETDEKVRWKGSNTIFTKVFSKDLFVTIKNKNLDNSQLGVLLRLTEFIGNEDNILRDKNGTPMTQKDIYENINMTKQTMSRIMKTLIENELVFKGIHPDVKNAHIYYLSPTLFYQGQYINREIKDQIDKIYKYDLNGLSEKELEEMIIQNLSIIENGMTLIQNQYHVANGFIDILARDKNNKLCIIELKVKEDDDRLIQQCVYYPSQFEEETRMISIAPNYSKKILDSLKHLKYVEIKTYKFINSELFIN